MKKLNFLNKIVFFFNSVVATLLLLSYVLPFVPPKTFSVLSVLSLGVPVLILVNVLFFLYWLLKTKKQFFLSFFVLVIGYLSFGSLYKFTTPNLDVNSENSLKVMNYNVRLFNLYHWIEEKNIEIKLIDFIKEKAPDVVTFQEYHPHENVDLSFFKYKYEKLSGSKTQYGQAIYSQYPIINSGSIDFPSTANNAIFADIVKNKDTIRIYNIHLQSLKIETKIDLSQENSERLVKSIGKSFEMQQTQAELFLKHKEQCKHKMIISGDFNNTAFSYVYKEIKEDLTDAFKVAGNGFGRTYDFRFFPTRIDFILVDNHFQVDAFKTFDVQYSDHFPVMARLSLID